MARYIEKQWIFEAEQWFSGKKIPGVDNAEGGKGEDFAFVQTIDGLMKVSHGDYVITFMGGSKIACRPDIFHQLYEKVEDGMD